MSLRLYPDNVTMNQINESENYVMTKPYVRSQIVIESFDNQMNHGVHNKFGLLFSNKNI